MKHSELYVQINVLSNLYSQSIENPLGVANKVLHKDIQVRRILDDFFSKTEIGKNYFISSEASGRPCIQIEGAASKFFSGDFNISHSNGSLAVFVCFGSSTFPISVGCDIECIIPRISRLDIATEYFYPQEIQWIFTDHGDERFERFYRIWTAKESWLKFWGKSIFGISATPIFSPIPQDKNSCLNFHQFFLQSPAREVYVLTVVAPFSVSEDSLFLEDGWCLRSSAQIYAAESPMSTVSPKI